MHKKMKMGIMGGTFNPIHFGHLILAESAYENLELDSVVFIPAGIPPHKQEEEIVSKKDRLKMVDLAIDDNNHFEVSPIELDKKSISYSYETLEVLKKENNNTDYYFIIGSDSFYNIEKWKAPEILLSMCKLVVAARNDQNMDRLKQQKRVIEKKFKTSVHILNMPTIDISSSDIRDRVKYGKTIKYFVPKDVENYIYMNDLYK
ncbi:nicotinate-nucleotide adenylyltransferase [Natranaerovirga pectinivora]|uniref:Probable nicotinate-nucleotide adenylyltransferase n=1 Tax=Natranaerovirga pectinivora TaxID=682400 RepID=A0A4R3MPJ8_9FIRM|nr:nicotinate-nucleotide adenylyltransferase [Natranaerovirga pectinivora]TCT14902.1 nicotinate-nucleotide adenylyltransferase [Natranaerovirga pectinivora]